MSRLRSNHTDPASPPPRRAFAFTFAFARACAAPVALAGLALGCGQPQPAPKAASDRAAPTSAEFCDRLSPDFNNATPPMDYDGPLPGPYLDSKFPLAVWAWQHFVALNWPSAYNDDSTRGTPSKRLNFLGVGPGYTTVWQTYRNKNEMFPAGSQQEGGVVPDRNYNFPPRYQYDNVAGPCDPKTDTDPYAFINLDENSQLGLNYMFAQPPGSSEDRQILYLAKVNQANYDYIVKNQLYVLDKQKARTENNLSLGLFGRCQQSDPETCSQDPKNPGKGYCLPCGGKGATPELTSEGTIHVKAAWRKLTPTEAGSGRYFTAATVHYKAQDGKVCYTNDKGQTWGLVGLHIIHKTARFPTFFFATWEHDDNASTGLNYMNTADGGPPDTVGKHLPWYREIVDGTQLPATYMDFVNNCVQSKIAEKNPRSPWQYYRLIGVQGPPVDYQDRDKSKPEYFLANNVIESNDFFQQFQGDSGTYIAPPPGTHMGTNLKTADGTSYNVGGCQGCHGNSQLKKGLDMSFISAGFANEAEPIGVFESKPKSARVRFYLGDRSSSPAPKQ